MSEANHDEVDAVLLGTGDGIRSDALVPSSESRDESASVALQHRAVTVAEGNADSVSMDGEGLLGPSSQVLPPVTWESSDSAAAIAGSTPSRGKWLQTVNTNASSASLYCFCVGILAAALALSAILLYHYLPSPLTSRHDCTNPNTQADTAAGSKPLGFSRPLSVLPRPVVILVSLDGFRVDYLLKTHAPTLNSFLLNGTWADGGMLPVFPSVTFPNHYSLATGLLPSSHGIVANHFRDPSDPTGPRFTIGNTLPKWWRGEALWETAERQDLLSATCFWPGTNVVHPGAKWQCPADRCHRTFNESMAFHERVDQVLSWLDLPPPSRPSFLTLYFEEPDASGHWGGPDTPRITAAIQRVDAAVGRLMDGLRERGILEDVHVMVVSDHGMLSVCSSRAINLHPLSSSITSLSPDWMDGLGGAQVGLFPPPDVTPAAMLADIQAALSSGKVDNSEFVSVFLRDDAPPHLNISSGDRFPPIFLSAAEGYLITYESEGHSSSSSSGGHSNCHCAGQHGFDNSLASMRAIFMAVGPSFAANRRVAPFLNVEVYNVVCRILGIQPAPNNGSLGFSDSMLLPHGP